MLKEGYCDMSCDDPFHDDCAGSRSQNSSLNKMNFRSSVSFGEEMALFHFYLAIRLVLGAYVLQESDRGVPMKLFGELQEGVAETRDRSK